MLIPRRNRVKRSPIDGVKQDAEALRNFRYKFTELHGISATVRELVVVGEREPLKFLHVRGATTVIVGPVPERDEQQPCPRASLRRVWRVPELWLDRPDPRHLSSFLTHVSPARSKTPWPRRRAMISQYRSS